MKEKELFKKIMATLRIKEAVIKSFIDEGNFKMYEYCLDDAKSNIQFLRDLGLITPNSYKILSDIVNRW